MKVSLVALLLLAVLLVSHVSSENVLCGFCNGMIEVPEQWSDAQQLLRYGCGKLEEAMEPCIALVNAADLTSSYTNMYQYIMKLKEMGCQKFCKA